MNNKTVKVVLILVMDWQYKVDKQTWQDAKETAIAHFGVKIEVLKYEDWPLDKFKCVQNHRAELGKTLEEIFPPEDRPRGIQDILSVKYHMKRSLSYPIVILKYGPKRLILLDGAHRLVAAFLTGTPIIRVLIVKPKK